MKTKKNVRKVKAWGVFDKEYGKIPTFIDATFEIWRTKYFAEDKVRRANKLVRNRFKVVPVTIIIGGKKD